MYTTHPLNRHGSMFIGCCKHKWTREKVKEAMRYEILKFTTKKLFKQMRLIYQNTCFPENKTNLYIHNTRTQAHTHTHNAWAQQFCMNEKDWSDQPERCKLRANRKRLKRAREKERVRVQEIEKSRNKIAFVTYAQKERKKVALIPPITYICLQNHVLCIHFFCFFFFQCGFHYQFFLCMQQFLSKSFRWTFSPS